MTVAGVYIDHPNKGLSVNTFISDVTADLTKKQGH